MLISGIYSCLVTLSQYFTRTTTAPTHKYTHLFTHTHTLSISHKKYLFLCMECYTWGTKVRKIITHWPIMNIYTLSLASGSVFVATLDNSLLICHVHKEMIFFSWHFFTGFHISFVFYKQSYCTDPKLWLHQLFNTLLTPTPFSVCSTCCKTTVWELPWLCKNLNVADVVVGWHTVYFLMSVLFASLSPFFRWGSRQTVEFTVYQAAHAPKNRHTSLQCSQPCEAHL